MIRTVAKIGTELFSLEYRHERQNRKMTLGKPKFLLPKDRFQISPTLYYCTLIGLYEIYSLEIRKIPCKLKFMWNKYQWHIKQN